MENLSMCRICLATDIRLCSIASHLRDMYERISSIMFKREDGRPLLACYICHARLNNSYRLRTSCLQSEELLTMMSSGELKPQNVLSTNTFRLVSALHLSLGHVLQDNIECQVKEETPEIIHDNEITDMVMEAQEEQCVQIVDYNQCSHLDDPLNVIKGVDDVETDDGDIKLEIEDTILEENDPNDLGSRSQLAYNMCPKIVQTVLQRIDVDDNTTDDGDIKLEIEDTILEENDPNDLGSRLQLADNICPKIVKTELQRIDVDDNTTDDGDIKLKIEDTILEENDIIGSRLQLADNICPKIVKTELQRADVDDNTTGACVSKKNETAALKNTEDTATNKRKIEVEKNKETVNMTIKEPKIVTNKTGVEKPVATPYECTLCKKCFARNIYLKAHIRRTHTSVKPYACNICNKCFTLKSILKRHILTHTVKKPYACTICKKCFTDKSNLKSHIQTHTVEKPYVCNDCKKSFIRKNYLISHMRIHTGEMPYHCNICKKCFSYKRELKTHILRHTGEKPYHCNDCKKCFTRKLCLIRHIRTHTGEKPYHCNDCKKYFNDISNLKKHMLTHTGEKPYHCNVCTKCFVRRAHLKRHICTHRYC